MSSPQLKSQLLKYFGTAGCSPHPTYQWSILTLKDLCLHVWIFNKTPFISYFIFLCWKNMIFRNHAPIFKYPPQYFVIVYTTHHVSRHYLSKKLALLVVNQKWPTPTGWKIILSQQCWIFPSDLSSLPCMPILKHSFSNTARSKLSSITVIIYTISYVSKQLS